jgi:hypothetical protein
MENKQEQTVWMRDEDVWDVPGLGFDGINGKRLISLARQSWGIGLNAERHITKQQKRGYAGGLKVEVPTGQLRTEKEAEEFYSKLKKKIAGVNSEDAILMLREGMKAEMMQMSNTDAQFIEQRRLSLEEEALRFGLESILGDSTNSSYNSQYEKSLAYKVNCLSRWTTAQEEQSNIKLLTESERRRGYYWSYDDRSILRMDASAIAAFIAQLTASRTLTKNECRALVGYNPVKDGDVFENPAIDKAAPDNSSGGAANTPKEPLKTTESKAILAHFGHLFGVEAHRVTSGAEKATNFIEWIDNYYAKNFEPMLADNFEAMGLDRELATVHCVESKRRLLEVCDYSQTDTLVANVSKCVSSWKSRANNLGVEYV